MSHTRLNKKGFVIRGGGGTKNALGDENGDNKSIQRGNLAHFAILWWKITLFVAFSV